MIIGLILQLADNSISEDFDWKSIWILFQTIEKLKNSQAQHSSAAKRALRKGLRAGDFSDLEAASKKIEDAYDSLLHGKYFNTVYDLTYVKIVPCQESCRKLSYWPKH